MRERYHAVVTVSIPIYRITILLKLFLGSMLEGEAEQL